MGGHLPQNLTDKTVKMTNNSFCGVCMSANHSSELETEQDFYFRTAPRPLWRVSRGARFGTGPPVPILGCGLDHDRNEVDFIHSFIQFLSQMHFPKRLFNPSDRTSRGFPSVFTMPQKLCCSRPTSAPLIARPTTPLQPFVPSCTVRSRLMSSSDKGTLFP